MKPNTLKLRPSDILWTQSSIKKSFGDGKLIGETLDELCNGTCQIQNIRRIRVFKRDHCWWSLDNRRLWVFIQFERLGGCAQIAVSVTTPTNEDLEKLTTNTFGKTIHIRGGDPGGKWHQKPNRTLAKEKNRNNENHPTAKNASDMYFAEANKKPIQQSRCSDLPPSRKCVTSDGTSPNIPVSAHSYNNNSYRTVSYLDEIRRELGFHTKTINVRRSEARNIYTFSAKNTTASPITSKTSNSSNTDTSRCSTVTANTSYLSAELKETKVSLDVESRNVSSFSDNNTTIKTTGENRSSGERAKLISSNNSYRIALYLDEIRSELGFHAKTNNVSRSETTHTSPFLAMNTTASLNAIINSDSSDTDTSGCSTVSANTSYVSAAPTETRVSLDAVARSVSSFSDNNTTSRPAVIETTEFGNTDARGSLALSANNSNSRASRDSLRANAYSTTAQTNVPSVTSTIQYAKNIRTDRKSSADFYQVRNVGLDAEASDHKLISSANNNNTRTVSHLDDKTKDLGFHAHKNNVSCTEVNTTARRPAVDTRCSSNTDSSGRSNVSANNSDLSTAVQEARQYLNAGERRFSRDSTNSATCRPVVIETTNSWNSGTSGQSTCSASNSNSRVSSETYPKTTHPNVPSRSSTSPGSDIGFAVQASYLKETEWITERCCCAIS